MPKKAAFKNVSESMPRWLRGGVSTSLHSEFASELSLRCCAFGIGDKSNQIRLQNGHQFHPMTAVLWIANGCHFIKGFSQPDQFFQLQTATHYGSRYFQDAHLQNSVQSSITFGISRGASLNMARVVSCQEWRECTDNVHERWKYSYVIPTSTFSFSVAHIQWWIVM